MRVEGRGFIRKFDFFTPFRKVTCECNEEDTNDDDDDGRGFTEPAFEASPQPKFSLGCWVWVVGFRICPRRRQLQEEKQLKS